MGTLIRVLEMEDILILNTGSSNAVASLFCTASKYRHCVISSHPIAEPYLRLGHAPLFIIRLISISWESRFYSKVKLQTHGTICTHTANSIDAYDSRRTTNNIYDLVYPTDDKCSHCKPPRNRNCRCCESRFPYRWEIVLESVHYSLAGGMESSSVWH